MGGENQGLQIALIILFVLIVMLAVVTFTLFTQNQQYGESLKAMQTERDNAINVEKKLTGDVYKLKEWIGLDPAAADDGLVEAEKAFNADKEKFMAPLPTEKHKYRLALEQTHADINTANEKTIQFTESVKQMETVNAQFEVASKKQVDEALAAKKKAEDDLASQATVFADAQRKAEDEKKDLVAKSDALQKQLSESTDAAKVEVESRDKKIAVLEVKNNELTETIKQLRGVGDIADDGEIRRVDQRSRIVWINLGRADALRPQVTFTVHGEGVPPGTSKAKIQVTQILDDHLAEARILEDSLTNPLIPGDKIYTALWDPGRQEHFYLAGRMDIGGVDGSEQLRSMVSLAGGALDGELDGKGQVTGSMNSQTRYLVLGEQTVACKTKYEQLIADAKLLGVEAIGLDKFLDHVGWKTATVGARFGNGGNVATMPRELPDGGVPATTGGPLDKFRSRRPATPVGPAAQPASAY